MGRCKFSKDCMIGWLRDNALLLLTLIGVIVGFVLAIAIKPANPSDEVIMWINLPGELFMRALLCAVLPIIVSSIITAVASLDLKTNTKMSALSFAYMVLIIILAVVLGLVLALSIKPGNSFSEASSDETQSSSIQYYETQDVFADLFRNLITNNIVQACVQRVYTEYDLVQSTSTNNVTNKTEIDIEVLSKSVSYSSGTNYLGILIFSMAFGLAMSVEPEHTTVMLQFFNAMKIIIFKILTVVLWTLPIATTSLIAGALLKVDDLLDVMVSLGLFSATVIVGLLIHTFFTIPLVYFIWTRKNPFVILMKSARSSIVVMVIRSSIGAMPEMFKSCERIGMHEKIYDFVVPLSVNFKKDGSAVFIAISCVWLAQTEGITLDAGQIVTIGIMASALSMCLPGIPSTSLVSIATIASSAGIPYKNIGVLIAMEWLLDAMRGGVNGASYVINTAIVDDKMASEMRLVDEMHATEKDWKDTDGASIAMSDDVIDEKNLAVATENTVL
ncbi:excitatory amino acid transporter 2-like [Saccoglossus kowalevskii]|uniref:Amino acid transporter n=1 Tax=Saccoglossus kowalevskii TaxID=10224 RepID=A0ABM0MY61_SACKO|nr:PREDICTED: excitatory amino acid transporter 2-like [Saccoglossus kowalevskii]